MFSYGFCSIDIISFSAAIHMAFDCMAIGMGLFASRHGDMAAERKIYIWVSSVCLHSA